MRKETRERKAPAGTEAPQDRRESPGPGPGPVLVSPLRVEDRR